MTAVQIDMRGALLKSATMMRIPAATKKQLSAWAADTVTAMKVRVKDMKKSGPGTSQLWRNIGFKVDVGEAEYRVRLGTGNFAGQPHNVIYASIQDKGGVIKAKKQYLTIPFPGVKGRAGNYGDAFIFKSKKGNLIIAHKTGKRGKLKPLFVLKKQVTIPATGWFTTTLNIRKPAMDAMMSPSAIYNQAASMVK